MNFNLVIVIGIIVALIGTVAACSLIMPAKKRDKLPSFLKFIHDLFNFKSLMLEKIVKALYVFLTLCSIVMGILLLFGPSIFIGLVVMILGPVLLRVIFELIMMRIIEVKNVISINRKIK